MTPAHPLNYYEILDTTVGLGGNDILDSDVGDTDSMKRWIPAVAFVLLGCVKSDVTCDETFLPRHIIWCLVAVLMAGALFVAKRPDISIFNHDIFLVALLWICYVLASAIFAFNQDEAIWGVAKHMLFFLTLLLLCWSIDEKLMVWSAAIIGTAMAGYGIYQWATTDDPMEIVGWMSNRNLLASGVFLCLMITGTSLDHRKWIPMAVMLILLYLTFNRTSILALIAAGGVLGVRSRAKLLWGVGVVGVLLCLAVWLNPERIDTESLRDRASLWRASVGMIKDRPAFGFGPGNWRICHPDYLEPNAGMSGNAYKNVFYIRPHNEYLGMAAESGIPAALLWLAIFAFAIHYAYKANEYWIAAGIIGFMVIMFFSFPIERAFHSFAILTLIAMAVRAAHTHKPQRLRGLKMIVAPGIILLVGITIVTIHRYTCDGAMRAVWIYKNYNQWDAIIDETEGMKSYVDYYNAPVEYYRGMAFFQKGNLTKALAEFEAGEKETPANVFLLNQLAITYALSDRLQESVDVYEYVLRLNPNFNLAASNLAKIRRKLDG